MDDKLDMNEMEKKALTSKLSISCGYSALFGQYILNEVGIESRVVAGLTLDEWNDYDNGHTMLEVNCLGEYVVYDIDNNCRFEAKGERLSFNELCECVNNDIDYDIIEISSDTKGDIYFGTAETSCVFYSEYIQWNENALKEWYRRVLQVALIESEQGVYHFCDEKNRERIESYSSSYKYVDKDAFASYYLLE